MEKNSEEYDPPMLTPMVFLKNRIRRDAIRKEVDGLLSVGKDGVMPLEAISISDILCRNRRRERSTMALKWKGPLGAKDRLCSMGDLTHSEDINESPTPYRSSIRTFLRLGCAGGISFTTLDISRAFAKAQALSQNEQVLITQPHYLEMHRSGIIDDDARTEGAPTHVSIMRKPFSGLSECQIRWFLVASACFRESGYRQRRADICTYAHHFDGEVDSITVLYVGDVPLAYKSGPDNYRFVKCTRRFRAGAPEFRP